MTLGSLASTVSTIFSVYALAFAVPPSPSISSSTASDVGLDAASGAALADPLGDPLGEVLGGALCAAALATPASGAGWVPGAWSGCDGA